MKSASGVNGRSPPGPGSRASESGRAPDRTESKVLSSRSAERHSRAKRHAAIRVSRRFGAPPERVFDAWLDPLVAGRWLFATASNPITHVEIDARVAGSFCFAERQYGEIVEHTGIYTAIAPHRRLAFTLSVEKQPHVVTRVTVAIAPFNKGCALTLTHENVPRACASRTRGRWTGILYGLGVTLDSLSERGSSAGCLSPQRFTTIGSKR